MADDKVMPEIRPSGFGHHMRGVGKKSEKLKNPKSTMKRLLKYLGKRKNLLVITFSLNLLTTVSNIAGTRLNGYTVDNFIKTGDINGLFNICAVLIVIYIVCAFSTYIQNKIMISIGNETSSNIRIDLYRSIQNLPLKFFDTHSSGDLMSRLTNDVDNINNTLSQSITQFFSGIVNILGMLIAMIILSPLLTVIGLTTVPLMFLITRFLVKKTQPFFIKQQKELGELNGFIEEKISGQKVIMLFNRQDNVKKEFENINKKLTKSAIFAQGFSGVLGPVNNFINNLTYLIVAVSGAYFILSNKGITVGILLSFILYMRNFTRPVNEILNVFNTILSALAGAERVFEIMDEPKESDISHAKEVTDLQGKIVLNKVDFSYKEGKKILKNISLTAEKGQVIAIVGPTGSGKTTIINLLTRFYDIDSGEILIDGVNINHIKRNNLRKSISMVLQDTYLFSESIRENIRYGRLTATDEEVEQAAVLANAHRFIRQLPEGYDTVLSDNGSNLSHGQRQLLAIARAILSQSSILILDEATSSIDTRTEIDIQKAMLNLMKGKTCFVIAHRLSTIRSADKILIVKDGEIVETGTHDELMKRESFYSKLYNSQFKGIEI
ncbi:ABC transporter ATP-binding protein/permease [Clostridium sp. SYSU_GA19001]|uniref:ABC transporter ATP-binding protein n=1 Tax=Clostridium caldaquaticum TaxID=2940653 RepID=UPI002076E5BF|nr:ABC transporter ATP-binding protein [Clostridium caldaquaticum]MCM8711777.1 ABC transporter ATP-binding protein/permease [Clostridium caldaquaticum]